jgi:hypothetical protein
MPVARYTDMALAQIRAAAGSNQAEWSEFDHAIMNIAREADEEVERLRQVEHRYLEMRTAAQSAAHSG